MSLNLRSFSATVSAAVAAAQASCASLLDLSVGTPGRALLESVSGVTLWLQYQAIQILLVTRLATSSGSDADSFVADYGMTRLPGTAATGSATLTSFTPSQSSAVVVPGVLVRTVSGVSYAVVKDSSVSTWSDTSGGYVRPVGTSSITVPVQAVTAGSSGNVAVGAICLLGTSVSGIDTVTNGAALTNGADQETDSELRARFPVWLAAKATANRASVQNAVASVQNGLTQELIDGYTPDNVFTPGYFTVVADDGSGTPSDALLSSIYDAISDVKALGVQYAVQAPTDVIANVSLTVLVPVGTDVSAVTTAVSTAISADITARAVGAGYEYSRLSYLAYTSAGVTVNGVTNVLLNGTQADIAASQKTTIRPGTITVTVSATS
ncbi:MAG: baseplate J/gp47 family protein [Gluconobacter japonicus]|uniref:baseplate J/gp47 family protein n=1 Tax=Gluconobacter japonicus TaxID=376620 RepID=UPI0039E7DEE7